MSTRQIQERPILFTPAMAQAIAEGRKTQARRVLKPQPLRELAPIEIRELCQGAMPLGRLRNPYGVPGDRLWVRESVARSLNRWMYRGACADGPPSHNTDDWDWNQSCDDRWLPNMHMPRVACRSVLEITGVRVERVDRIRTEDAVAEGFDNCTHFLNTFYRINKRVPEGSNPWVWVVEFQKVNASEVQGGASI